MPGARESTLDGVLAEYFPHDLSGTVLANDKATLVLDISDGGKWTVTIDGGTAKLSATSASRPTCSVQTDSWTLSDVLVGRRTGVEAFLDGDLTTRGSLATVLRFAGSLAPDIELTGRPRAREVEVDGVRTAYLEAGPADGAPLLLLHGLGATNASMLPILAEFADEYRVIAPDIPGFGASDAPGWDYTAQRLSRWLQAFLGAIEARGAIVVGNSLGGRVALELAMMDPSAANALVLLCPSPAFRRFRQLSSLVKLLPVSFALLPQAALPRPLMMAGLRKLFAHPSRVPKSWFDATLDEYDLSMRRGRYRRAALSALTNIYTEEAFGDKGFWDRLHTINCPTLFLWGDADRLVPAGFARHITGVIPSADSVVIPDCGHVPQLELPALTTEMIRRFLRPSQPLHAVPSPECASQ